MSCKIAERPAERVVGICLPSVVLGTEVEKYSQFHFVSGCKS